MFLSSHILSEVQAICDRVAILRSGQLQAVQRVDELMHTDFRHVLAALPRAVSASRAGDRAGGQRVSAEGNTLTFQLIGDFDPLLRAISSYYVEDIEVQEPSLEEVFLKFYSAQPVVNNHQKAEVHS